MEKVILRVDGMSCEHCENAVQTAVGALAGVQEVKADKGKKEVFVVYDSSLVELSAMHTAIEEIGFDMII